MQFTRKTDLLVFQPLHLLTIGYITVQEKCIGFKLLFVFFYSFIYNIRRIRPGLSTEITLH